MTGVEIAALASAAISAGTGTASAISAGKANKRGVKYAEKENGLQREFQERMYNRQIEWNDPKNMMARLKEAGINPHYYIGGNPTAQSPNVPSSGGGVAINQKGVDFSPISQAGQTMLQSEMMKAQIENIKANTNKTNTDAEGSALANGVTAQRLENLPTEIDIANQSGRENIELLKAKTELEEQRLTTEITKNENLKQQTDNLITSKGLTEQQTKNLITSMALTIAQIKTEGIKQQNIKADTGLKKAEINYKNESAKTQSHVRSNLSANTAYQNASRKNLEADYINIRERGKANIRANEIGGAFDYSNAEISNASDRQRLEIIRQSYRNLTKDEKFRDLQIEEKEYTNLMLQYDMYANPIKDAVDMGTKVTPQNSTTTTRHDSDGNYSGHTTTRRHR